ncbi:tetratricopeptide repeat protein, partial [Patescibacteria group bacterium]|nr:tetratricopeptide repeat protein [Patescibacteria group bacterium]
MQNSKKITTRIAIFLFSMLLFVGPVYAGLMSSAGVKKAQEFVDAGRKDGAINALNDWLNKNPKDDDAYWMLANLYMQKGEYDRAEEQFGYFLNLRSGKQGVVTDKFKEAFRHEVASGSLYKAKSLAQKLIGFQSTYRQQVYASFYAKGKSSFGQIAVDNFDAALLFANNQGEREKIGKNFLKIALEDSHFGYLVEKAVNILGKDFVNQVMPSQNDEIIFSHTYTDADIGPDGKVIVLDYAKTLLMPGDVLNINTIMPR